MNKRIFIIDDEPELLKIASRLLESDRYAVAAEADPHAGLRKIKQNPPDLVLLDICMDGLDGFQICKDLKTDPKTSHVPIIMISVKSDESDAVVGLELGADDYIRKPFHKRELLARVKAVLRRKNGDEEAHRLTVGPLRIDLGAYTAWLDDEPLHLTPKEFEILSLLVRKRGRVLTRATISEAIWGTDFTKLSRTIDTHVDNIRRKLGKHGAILKGLKGVGYRFEFDE